MAALPAPEEKELLKLTLVSSDGVNIEIDEKVARKSEFLANMIDNTGAVQEEMTALPLDNFDAETLKKVFEWCEKNKDKAAREKDPVDRRITLTDDEQKYADMPCDKLTQVLLCANFLNIEELIDVLTQRIVNMTDGMDVVAMRKFFCFKDDLDDQTKAEIRKKHEWCRM